MNNLLVTGGCGFIGCNFVLRYWLAQHLQSRVVVYDNLTYAGRKENIHDLCDDSRLKLVSGDIGDQASVRSACQDEDIDLIVNFAAETHVDQSIFGPLIFTDTNVRGTHVLLEVARELVFSGEQPMMVYVPSGVAYSYHVGEEGATLIYMMNAQFDIADPNESRLPLDHFGQHLWAEDRG